MKPKFFIAALTLLMLYNPLSTFAQSPHKLEKEKPVIKYQGEISLSYNFNNRISENWAIGDDGYSHSYKSNFSTPAFLTTHGISLSKNQFTYGFFGIGTGIQYAYGKMNKSSSERWNTMIMPIFFNVKAYLPVTQTFSFYASTSIGWNFCLMNGLKTYGAKNKGGFFGEIEIGAKWKNLSFGVGYQNIGMNINSAQQLTGNRNSFEYNVDSYFIKLTYTF